MPVSTTTKISQAGFEYLREVNVEDHRLRELGEDGWELVSVATICLGERAYRLVFFFKRAIAFMRVTSL